MGVGREHGAAWEDVIVHRARSNGLLALKNGLSAVFIGGGGVRVVKSDLDFRLISRLGQVAYFDAKTFNSGHFDYSDLLAKKEPRDNQIERARLYLDWGLSAGFLVWFRPIDRVVFYRGDIIIKAGPGTRFKPDLGCDIGSLATFDMRALISPYLSTRERGLVDL